MSAAEEQEMESRNRKHLQGGKAGESRRNNISSLAKAMTV